MGVLKGGDMTATDPDKPDAEIVFQGVERMDWQPGSPLSCVDAGARLMARFRNRLDHEQQQAGRLLPHVVRFRVEGGFVLCESVIYA